MPHLILHIDWVNSLQFPKNRRISSICPLYFIGGNISHLSLDFYMVFCQTSMVQDISVLPAISKPSGNNPTQRRADMSRVGFPSLCWKRFDGFWGGVNSPKNLQQFMSSAMVIQVYLPPLFVRRINT